MRRWGQAANPLWPTETPSSAGGRSSRNRSSEDVPDAGLEMVQVHVEGDAGVGVGAGREQRPAPVEMGGRHRVRGGEDEQEGADMEEDADLEAFRLPTPKVLLGTDAPKDINGESSSNFSVDDSEPLMQRVCVCVCLCIFRNASASFFLRVVDVIACSVDHPFVHPLCVCVHVSVSVPICLCFFVCAQICMYVRVGGGKLKDVRVHFGVIVVFSIFGGVDFLGVN